MLSSQSSPDRRDFSTGGFEVHHFKYADSYDSAHFKHAPVSPYILTLLIRTDARFATRHVINEFSKRNFQRAATECTSPETINFANEVDTAYEAWGQRVVADLTHCLNYETEYGLENGFSQVHFHKGSALVRSTIEQSECLFNRDKETPLFISLDDMIDHKAFVAANTKGNFAEVCFSRRYSENGIKSGFVNRPGCPPIDVQLSTIHNTLKAMRGQSDAKVPIILLEDNVRKGETLLWIFGEMEKNGIFKDAELRGIATCFSVATAEEQARIRQGNKQIPVVVGADYLAFNKSPSYQIDVITPRDHFFDGLVVQSQNGSLGRYPSVMFSDRAIAQNFKIAPAKSACFKDNVLRHNIDFCESIQDSTDVVLTLSDFKPGLSMSKALDLRPSEPMTKALTKLQALHVTPS